MKTRIPFEMNMHDNGGGYWLDHSNLDLPCDLDQEVYDLILRRLTTTARSADAMNPINAERRAKSRTFFVELLERLHEKNIEDNPPLC